MKILRMGVGGLEDGVRVSWQRMEVGVDGEMGVGWIPFQLGLERFGGPETSTQLPAPAAGGRG